MKSLTNYISEKLVINKNYNPYTCAPKSFKELKKIIEQRYEEQGPGTEQKPINFNDIDVSNIVSFCNENNIGIFEKTKFEYIDVSDWYVSKIKNTSFMFYKCRNLKSVGDLSKWNVSNVKDMSYMFDNCENLESVGDLSRWNVNNVKNTFQMFYKCRNLKSVDLSKWNVSNVKNMSHMFSHSGITNIPNWYKE